MAEKKPNRPVETYDPFAPPDWRWQPAGNIVRGTKRLEKYFGDEYVSAAVEHLRACDSGQSKDLNPAIAESLSIFRDSTSLMKAELEARLVSGQSRREIARACHMPEDVVAQSGRIFFETPPHAIDCLLKKVVGYSGLHRV